MPGALNLSGRQENDSLSKETVFADVGLRSKLWACGKWNFDEFADERKKPLCLTKAKAE